MSLWLQVAAVVTVVWLAVFAVAANWRRRG